MRGFPDREEREKERRELTEKKREAKSFFPSAAVLEGKRHRAE